jgi:hypothetical protein
VGKTAEELRNDLRSQRAEISGTLDAIGDRVSPGRIADRTRTRWRVRTQSWRYRVMGAPHTEPMGYGAPYASSGATSTSSDDAGITDRAREQVQALGERASDAVHGVRDQATGNPLAAGLVAFGAGLLVASLFPASRPERRLADQVQPALDDAARELGDAGRSVADSVREPARDAARQVQERASEEAHGAVDDVRSGSRT